MFADHSTLQGCNRAEAFYHVAAFHQVLEAAMYWAGLGAGEDDG